MRADVNDDSKAEKNGEKNIMDNFGLNTDFSNEDENKQYFLRFRVYYTPLDTRRIDADGLTLTFFTARRRLLDAYIPA